MDPERVGILGICGWGGMAVNAAANDPRIKATVASTMYDISRVNANGYFDADDSKEARNAVRRQLCAQRTKDYKEGEYALAGGLPDVLRKMRPSMSKITGPIVTSSPTYRGGASFRLKSEQSVLVRAVY